jgi:predicted DNA-binding transcriptional regulator AlpA
MSHPDRFLSPAEVAGLLGVSTRTLERYVASGRLPPPVRFSPKTRRWRYGDLIAAAGDSA